MRMFILSALLLVATRTTVVAQPYAADNTTIVSPPASPPAIEDSQPVHYLRVAQAALAAGRVAEVREALEMAQTRMLDRSVPQGRTNSPSDNHAVDQISQALRALAADDRSGCEVLVQAAVQSAYTQGFNADRR